MALLFALVKGFSGASFKAVIILKKHVAGLTEAALARFTTRAAAAAGLRGQVNVLLTTNRELQALNRRFRGKDQATDVLSFPAHSVAAKALVGDIAISAEIAAANANKLGHRVRDEVKILVLHGVLHLAGYDHERDNGTMARKEARLRRALNLPASLIERQNQGGRTPASKSKGSRGTSS